MSQERSPTSGRSIIPTNNTLMRPRILLLSYLLTSLCLTSMSAQAEHNASDIKSLIYEADSCRQSNNLYRALKLYEEAYAQAPSPLLMRRIIQCHYDRGGYQRCIALYDTISPDSIVTSDLKMKFLCFSNIAQMDSAIHYGRMANIADPHDCKIVSKLASHYNKTQQPDSALHIANLYCLYDSTNIFVNRQKAHSLYLMEDYEEALHEYKRLKRDEDINESTLYYLALCYAKSDSLYQAYENYKKAAEIGHYENPHIMAQLGIVATELGLAIEGVDYIEQSIEMMQPDEKLMYALTKTLAKGYFDCRQYDKAIASMKQSLKYPDSDIYTYYRIAQAYGMKKELKSEREYYQKFVDKAQKEPSPTPTLKERIEYANERINKITETLFFQGEK